MNFNIPINNHVTIIGHSMGGYFDAVLLNCTQDDQRIRTIS